LSNLFLGWQFTINSGFLRLMAIITCRGLRSDITLLKGLLKRALAPLISRHAARMIVFVILAICRTVGDQF